MTPRRAVLVLLFLPSIAFGESICFGTTGAGRLSGAVQLPSDGVNFQSYGAIPTLLGRTYVHSTVAEIVVDAYSSLASTRPRTVYVYGETGYEEGGKFSPHKTHQNGLSVDFMVPVVDGSGASVFLPTSVLNKWGYDIDFDPHGRWEELQIDFEAIGEHIVALHKAARKHGVDLWRVIFAPDLQDALYATSSGSYIRQHVRIPEKRSWVRHDDHYHVDFAIPCQPLS